MTCQGRHVHETFLRFDRPLSASPSPSPSPPFRWSCTAAAGDLSSVTVLLSMVRLSISPPDTLADLNSVFSRRSIPLLGLCFAFVFGNVQSHASAPSALCV